MTETKEYRNIDKSTWGSGPWVSEPDKRQWTDPATGLACLLVRAEHHGSLCGYVGIPSTHPAHGLHAYSSDDSDYQGAINGINVHGGLTFAGGCDHRRDESLGICHVPAAGEPDDVWWFGFDCAHAWDHLPAMAALGLTTSYSAGTYRTTEYVTEECAKLALQLKAIV